jgi:hypothetical protein
MGEDLIMNARLTFHQADDAIGVPDCREILARLDQVRCHLGCVGRQLKRGRVRCLPFHLRGILRALCVSW